VIDNPQGFNKNSIENLKCLPNPFTSNITIEYEIDSDQSVSISILNILGQHINTLHKGELTEGNYHFSWDAADAPDGLYFVMVICNGSRAIRKIIKTK